MTSAHVPTLEYAHPSLFAQELYTPLERAVKSQLPLAPPQSLRAFSPFMIIPQVPLSCALRSTTLLTGASHRSSITWNEISVLAFVCRSQGN